MQSVKTFTLIYINLGLYLYFNYNITYLMHICKRRTSS